MYGRPAAYLRKVEDQMDVALGSVQDIRDFKRSLLLRIDGLNSFKASAGYVLRDGRSQAEVCFQMFLSEQDEFRRMLGMPKKTVKESSWKGFVNYKPTTEEFNAFAAWDVEDDELFLAASTIVAEGYKLSTSFDKTKGTFVATLFCNDGDSPNGGWALSSFAPTWYDALRLVVYKHEVIFHGVWLIPIKGGGTEQWG